MGLSNEGPTSNTDPAFHGIAVTPHVSNPIRTDGALTNPPCRMLYVGGTGSLTLRLKGDTADIVLAGVPAGAMLMLAVTHVRATSTATLLVALW